jgi:hypothetical protein
MRQRTVPRKEAGKILQKLMGKKQAAKAWDAKCSASLTHFPVSWPGGTSIISSSELERNYYTICMGLNCT